MKSFNSFEQIAAGWKLPDQWLPNHERYWAHTHKVKVPELFLAHVSLVNEYALRLIRAHKLDEVVDRLIEDLLAQSGGSLEVGNYLKGLFWTATHFHDYGKINPNFQFDRMKNRKNFSPDKSIKIGSQHSRLSAYLYLNHHISAIKRNASFSNDEQVFLWTFSFLFADAIFLHHSGDFYHDVKLDYTMMPSLRRFLDMMEKDADGVPYIQGHGEVFRHFWEELNLPAKEFAGFALLKLAFSVLTASDYLATGEFMNDMSVTDFGLMDEGFKKKLGENFRSIKVYNRAVFKCLDAYKQFPFEKIHVKSKRNLNRLRQKLTAEVISNIREHTEVRLFYLEAPTGSGKTNLSLALAIELLEANPELNKVFYVFPFTTLITQTFRGLRETAGLKNDELIQLHSKAGFHQKEESEDGLYGDEKLNFIDNLFIHYPVSLLTHIRFFDILKGNDKESNYIMHRLANSVVIIDELQSYNPRHWDKVIFFLSEYARFFNIRFVLMSATLPYIDDLLEESSPMRGKVVRLVKNKNDYFLNPNFGERVVFDFDLLENWKKPSGEEARKQYLDDLKKFLFEKSEARAAEHDGQVRVIIEFIKKKSASAFFRLVCDDPNFEGYEKFLISGEILEPRRREIITAVKEGMFEKILLVTTQVVEAGVDIDMDLGFKDKSIADSDEQLAGRVNRNSSKNDCIVYLFDFDEKASVYGRDERYKMKIDVPTHRRILHVKDFQLLYNLVKAAIQERNDNEYLTNNLQEYLGHFKTPDFRKINRDFRLIEENGLSVFVPLPIPARHLEEEKEVLKFLKIEPDNEGNISGKEVWEKYEAILQQSKDSKYDEFIEKQVLLKQIGGLMSKFIFSFFVQPGKPFHQLSAHGEDKYGFFYLSHWSSNDIYTYNGGLDMEKVNSDQYF